MAIWNTFRKNSFKFGYEGHLVLTVYLKKYLMGKWLRGPDSTRLLHPAPETWHILLFLSKRRKYCWDLVPKTGHKIGMNCNGD
ncbi:hypothetical protein D1A27_16180 [Klebsiella pneumoniae]|nr:hypothetical protein D1A27_16180 [Klebsiella pneumoniae]